MTKILDGRIDYLKFGIWNLNSTQPCRIFHPFLFSIKFYFVPCILDKPLYHVKFYSWLHYWRFYWMSSNSNSLNLLFIKKIKSCIHSISYYYKNLKKTNDWMSEEWIGLIFHRHQYSGSFYQLSQRGEGCKIVHEGPWLPEDDENGSGRCLTLDYYGFRGDSNNHKCVPWLCLWVSKRKYACA